MTNYHIMIFPVAAGHSTVPANTTSTPRTFASVVESARVANISDGATVYLNDRDRIGTMMGCEARFRHSGQSGGNFTFLDGHAKYIVGNSQRYHDKDSNGCVYMRYHTADR